MIQQSPCIWPPSFLDVVSRHKKTIVLVPAITLLAGALFFVFCPRKYRSEARFFLRIGRETVGIDPAATTGQVLPLYTTNLLDEVKSAEEIFRSRGVAAKVVDQLGPDVVICGGGAGGAATHSLVDVIKFPLNAVVNLVKSVDPISEREEAVIKIERSLSVGGDKQATVIVVKCEADSPEQAQAICAAVVEVGQKEYIRAHRSDQSNPFFTEQQQLLREQLDASLDSLRKAKDEMGLANVDQRRQTLEAQYSAVELDRLSTNQQLATSAARIKDLEKQLTEIPENLLASTRSVPNQGADMLRDRLYELQVAAANLEAHYRAEHPYVQAAKDQLDKAGKVLEEQASKRTETTDELNPIYQKLALSLKQERNSVAGFESRIKELDEQQKAVLADLRTLNQHDLKIDQLTRETELARNNYMQYSRIMEESRIDKELQIDGVSNISVVQQATLAEKPIFPSRGLTAAGTLVLAAAGTLGLVLFGERKNWNGRNVEETNTSERRRPRRRVRRELVSKSNGHTNGDGPHPLAE